MPGLNGDETDYTLKSKQAAGALLCGLTGGLTGGLLLSPVAGAFMALGGGVTGAGLGSCFSGGDERSAQAMHRAAPGNVNSMPEVASVVTVLGLRGTLVFGGGRVSPLPISIAETPNPTAPSAPPSSRGTSTPTGNESTFISPRPPLFSAVVTVRQDSSSSLGASSRSL